MDSEAHRGIREGDGPQAGEGWRQIWTISGERRWMLSGFGEDRQDFRSKQPNRKMNVKQEVGGEKMNVKQRS